MITKVQLKEQADSTTTLNIRLRWHGKKPHFLVFMVRLMHL